MAFVCRELPPGADDEVVGVRAHRPHVEDDDVSVPASPGRCRQYGEPVQSKVSSVRSPESIALGVCPRYRPSRSISAATAGGTRPSIGSPAATRRRMSVELMGVGSISKAVDARRALRSTAWNLAFPRPPSRASSSTASGSFQLGKSASSSAPIDEHRVVQPASPAHVDRPRMLVELDVVAGEGERAPRASRSAALAHNLAMARIGNDPARAHARAPKCRFAPPRDHSRDRCVVGRTSHRRPESPVLQGLVADLDLVTRTRACLNAGPPPARPCPARRPATR